MDLKTTRLWVLCFFHVGDQFYNVIIGADILEGIMRVTPCTNRNGNHTDMSLHLWAFDWQH